MSKLYITEYRWLGYDVNMNALAAPQVPSVREDSIEVTLSPQQSKPFMADTRFIGIKADTSCWLAFGEDPEARPGLHPVDVGERLYYGVFPGQKLSVIGGRIPGSD